ncbi:hypothetical protein B0H15DRAFT_175936 [Mycena belliarum]|uniref:Uncharacterized protein n=1 Tax=Mycena belliarum TaxID=1033014 RepID=A0AAD6XTZ6_9AGAR|nr:hypothetical protein B0H15DRAFT_175936 [Mycena belliae]
MNLDTVPCEILERIAFLSATDVVVGPPSGLVTLLGANRQIHARLSFASNQYLYARIFAAKFDVGSLSRRFTAQSSPGVLAHELVLRFRVLHRIRAKMDAAARPGSAGDGDSVHELLFHAYLMMLENAGKNEKQLRNYAKMGDWLKGYLFEEKPPGRSRLTSHIENWPPHNDHTSLAMWLFWFLLRPTEYTADDDSTWNVLNVLKIYALGAHKYPLTDPSWVTFLPKSPPHSTHIVHYSEDHHLKTPPLATPAILAFLTLVNLKSRLFELSSPPLEIPTSAEGNEWEYELGRCLSLSRPEFDTGLSESFRPGSVEGTWEGIFTYTEFTAYAALLQGAPPPILQKSVIVRHKQTWKLREHHFIGGSGAPSCRRPPTNDSNHTAHVLSVDGDANPLSAGDPLRAYVPTGTHIVETGEGLEVYDPERPAELLYYRTPVAQGKDKQEGVQVQDIIITGEGHSAWGQFTLVGRVRPCDGFISLCKEYGDHDRGRWIYRGYLVGNINSNLAGRWRDTLSPAAVPGYEGCFLMTRRR